MLPPLAVADVALPPPPPAPLVRPSAPVTLAEPVLHTLALFTAVRGAEAYLYPEPFAETRPRVVLDGYASTFTHAPLFDGGAPSFRWDGDPWVINVVGHALLGSEVHLRARSCGFGVLPALAFSAVASAVWEYGFEGMGVRASAQDLVYTPLAGMALGELRFALVGLASRRLVPWAGTTVRFIADPFGESERRLGTRC